MQSLTPPMISPSHGKWRAGLAGDTTHPESQFCLQIPSPSALGQHGEYGNQCVLHFPLLSWWKAQVSRRKKQRALGGGHTTQT